MAGVKLEEVQFPGVTAYPSCQPFSVRFAALGKHADNGPSDIAVLGEPDLGLLLEGDHRLPDLERAQQARLNEERQERRRGPTAAREMPSVPCRDHQMTVSGELPLHDFGKAGANIFEERAIDCYAGHEVWRMPEFLEIGFRFTLALEGRPEHNHMSILMTSVGS